MKKSISTRMIVSLGLPAIIVLVILISVGVYLAMNSQKALAYKGTAAEAAQYANSFDAELRPIKPLAGHRLR